MSKKPKTASKKANKQYVQHNYVDHAYDQCFHEEDHSYERGGVAVPFPIKLHQMLDHIEGVEKDLRTIVSWQPHGRCFVVHEPKKFGQYVLGRFFQQNKYQSFQRQLNLYGFRRITKGLDRGGYYHELFLRGKQFLCSQMKRTKVKGTGFRKASDVSSEPNFYEMNPVGTDLAMSMAMVTTAAATATAAATTTVVGESAGLGIPLDLNRATIHSRDSSQNQNQNQNFNYGYDASTSEATMEPYPDASTAQSMSSYHQEHQQREMLKQQQQQQQQQQFQLFPVSHSDQRFSYDENANRLPRSKGADANAVPPTTTSHSGIPPSISDAKPDPDYDFNNMPIYPVHDRRHSLNDYSGSTSNALSFLRNVTGKNKSSSPQSQSQSQAQQSSSSLASSFGKRKKKQRSNSGSSSGSSKHSAPTAKGGELKFFFGSRSDKNNGSPRSDSKKKSKQDAPAIHGSIGDLKFFIV